MKPAPKPPSKSRMYEYDRMTGAELKAALEQLKMTNIIFAKLTGSNPRKVDEWLADQIDIPHHILVLVTTWATVPGSLEAAINITNTVVHFWAEQQGNDA